MTTGIHVRTRRPVAARSAARAARRPLGGADGNARLTAATGAVLLVLLAVEGATVPFLGALLSVHIFVGMLLLGPIALKLASTGYRLLRYYGGGLEYVEHGPPAPLMRVLVAPVLVASTITLFGTGVGLLVLPGTGAIVGLHKASFAVWFFAMGIHVLAYGLKMWCRLLPGVASARIGGGWLRVGVVGVALAVGLLVAVKTFPLAAPWLYGALRWDS